MPARSKTCPFRATPILIALAFGAAAAPMARADDDDQKRRDRKPSIVHPIVRNDGADPNAVPIDGPFPAHNVILKSWIPLSNFAGYSGGSGADCWGYTSPGGREYALTGLSWGNGIVEVTNPANPVILTTIPGSVDTLWRDIAVVGTKAYAVSDGGGVGIQVMNLANIDQGQVTLVGNYSPGGLATSHTLLQNTTSGYLYLCGSNIGGFMPLLPSLGAPMVVGPGWTNDWVHECQVMTYTSGTYAGREIAFLFPPGTGLAIVDVTNKANPVTLSQTQYPSSSYSHQGWVHGNGKYLYHDDELDGQSVPVALTRVFDVSDLSNPRLCAAFTNSRPAIDHNQYVSGAYLFQSNYTTGLRVWDLSEPLRPYEIAWIDTRPEDDAPTFNGNWGNYAYFPSGTVLASDLERGLFVARVSLLKVKFPAPPPGTLVAGQPTPVTAQIAVRDATLNASSVRLNVSVNNGAWTAIPMAAQGGGMFTAAIPAQSCTARVRYYVSARTSDDRLFTGPNTAPGEYFTAVSQTGQTQVFADDFETNLGWAAANAVAGTAGKWVRAIPAPNAGHGAAIGDADGSGRCYVTGNLPGDEVNGGPTRLTSPPFDLSAHPEAIVSYSYWLLSVQGTTDLLRTEVSDNNGATWKLVRDTGPSSGGWQRHSFRVADYAAASSAVKVRFSVGDTGGDSLTEAGIDAFAIVSPQCVSPCYPDCNTDGSLTVADFGCFQTRFVAAAPYADCNADSQLTVADFGCFQTKFVAGCP